MRAPVHDQTGMLRYRLFPIPIQALTIVLWLEIALCVLTTGIREMISGWVSGVPIGSLTEHFSMHCTLCQ